MKKLSFLILFLIGQFVLLAQTNLPTSWNFSNPGIANPPAGWTMNLGSNGNLTYAFGIGDALSCRLDATGENFVIHYSGKSGPLSYYLSPQNAGAAWGGQFDVQQSADGVSWTNLRSITTKATTVTNYTNGRYVDFPAESSRYIRFVFTQKLPGGVAGTPGGNMGVDSVWLQAPPASPAANLAVLRGATNFVSGAQTVIGNSTATSFTFQNKGSVQTLTIDSIVFTGAAATDFSVSGVPVSINASASANLNVQ